MQATAPGKYIIKAPELRGAILKLSQCRDTEVGIDGPAGTGKTFGILYFIHILLLMYAGCKWLVSRKYNIDLAGSAMATYQQLLDPREGIQYFGGSRVKPAGYNYPNGSFLAVNGLDRPSKLKSFEYDGVFINEATECDIEDLEFARMRLRKGNMPWQQVIMDFNPGAPNHWLNQRMNAGVTTRILSRHEDNPRYYDIKTQSWTKEGHDYIEGVLGGLTGVRLARYRYGLWAAAEGTVYEDAFDRSKNVIKRFDIPLEWPRYMSLDFGYTHPFVCKWYAQDPDGRLYCYREIYKTKTLVEDHAKLVKQLSRWGEVGGDPIPRYIYADHDAEGRATFERYTSMRTTKAYKAVKEGIQTMKSRLRLMGDGKPRLMYFEDMLIERDRELIQKKLPTCTLEEFGNYVWDTTQNRKHGEEPVKEYDHGLDCDRYLVATLDVKPNIAGYVEDPWG